MFNSEYELLNNFLDDQNSSKSILVIDEFRAQDPKLVQDFNWFLENSKSRQCNLVFVTASREKPFLKSTLPIRYLRLIPFILDQTKDLVTEWAINEKIQQNYEQIFSTSQGNPQLVQYICRNEEVANKILDGLSIEFDVLREVWNSVRTNGLARSIELISVFNKFEKELHNDLAVDLIPDWANDKDLLLDRSLIEEYLPTIYKMHDLLGNYVYEKLPKIKRSNIHKIIGDYYSSGNNIPDLFISFYHYVAAKDVNNSIRLHERLRDSIKLYTYSPLLEQSLKNLLLLIKSTDNLVRARILESLGYVHVSTDNYVASEREWLEAKNLFASTDDISGLAWSTLGLATLNRMKAEYPKALNDYELVNKYFRQAGDLRGAAWALRDKSEVLRTIGNYKEAKEIASTSLDLSKSVDDKFGIATTLRTIGDLYFTQSEFDAAMLSYENSLKISREIDAKMNEAYVLNAMAHLYRVKGKYIEAIRFSNDSLQLLELIRDLAGTCFSKFGLGEAIRMTKNYEDAIKEYTSARHIAIDIEHRDFESFIMLGFGEIHRIKGNFIQAGKAYQFSLEMSQELGLMIVEAHSLLGICETKRMNGISDIDLYDQAFSKYDKVNSKWGMIHTLIGKALAMSKEEELRNNPILKNAMNLSRSFNFQFEINYIDDIYTNENHPLCFPIM